jgi:hypothetical protein
MIPAQEERRIVELLTLLGPRLRRTANGRHIMCAARRCGGPVEEFRQKIPVVQWGYHRDVGIYWRAG